jgi:hypothetical protein
MLCFRSVVVEPFAGEVRFCHLVFRLNLVPMLVMIATLTRMGHPVTRYYHKRCMLVYMSVVVPVNTLLVLLLDVGISL